jgi:hypothetical protein
MKERLIPLFAAFAVVICVAAGPFDLISPERGTLEPPPKKATPERKLTFQEIIDRHVNTQKPGQKICVVTCKRCTPEKVQRERELAKQMPDTVVVEVVDDEKRVPDGVSDHHFSTEPSRGKLSIPPAGTKSPRTEENRGTPPGVVEDLPAKPTQFVAPPPPPGDGWKWDAANGVYRKVTYGAPPPGFQAAPPVQAYAYVYAPQPVTYYYTPAPVTYYATTAPSYPAQSSRAGIGFFGSRGGFAGIGYSTQAGAGSC